MPKKQSTGVLFEVMRSFVSLARSLNLSETVRQLDSTRQTVRRHIDLLEGWRGEDLFELKDRQYSLTQAGQRALPEAEYLLARNESWLHGDSGSVNGLDHVIFQEPDGYSFFSQQHPLNEMWYGATQLLREGYQLWSKACGRIESEILAPLRPYLIVYRQHGDDWLCVDIGSQSSYNSWYGTAWWRASIGHTIEGMPEGAGFAQYTAKAYRETYRNGGVRYDHVYTQFARGDADQRDPVSFQRLLMACQFPDRTFALASLVDRTHKVDISGLKEANPPAMANEMVMEVAFNPENATKVA